MQYQQLLQRYDGKLSQTVGTVGVGVFRTLWSPLSAPATNLTILKCFYRKQGKEQQMALKFWEVPVWYFATQEEYSG